MSSERGSPRHLRSLGDATEWLLARSTRLPTKHRGLAAASVVAMILAIGWVDNITGTQLSLVAIYLIPVALVAVWFGRGAGALAAVGAATVRFAADAFNSSASVLDTWLWWNSLGGLGVYLVVVWVLDALMRFHRQLEERVRIRTEELEHETRRRQEVQRQLLELSASERSAMGRELHDQLGQHLVGTAMAAQVLAQRLQTKDEMGGREARQIAHLLEQGIAQTRQLAHGMMLTQIDPKRLAAEFEELCATLRQQYPGVRCECVIDAPPVLVDPSAAAQVFRIGQEALRNGLRHSGGRVVRLTLSGVEGKLSLRVEDDGRGVPPESDRNPGLGLSIMCHRAEHLGARFQLDSTPGQGTRITCLVPLHASARLHS